MTVATVIDADLSCAICNYNLKGLSPDANCPECGQPVARTFTYDLSYSDPAWLLYQARTMLLLLGLCLANYSPGLRGGFGPSSLILSYLPLVACLVGAAGCWRLATPDPAGLPDQDRGMLHRSLRLVATLVVVSSVVVPLDAVVHPALWRTAALAGFGCLIATNVLVGLFTLGIARRSRDAVLIRHARIVLWSFPVIQISSLLAQFGFAFVLQLTDSFGESVVGLLGLLNFALSVAAYVAAFFFGRMHEALRAAARVSAARPDPVSAELAPPPAVPS
jgi:hypothetical protein